MEWWYQETEKGICNKTCAWKWNFEKVLQQLDEVSYRGKILIDLRKSTEQNNKSKLRTRQTKIVQIDAKKLYKITSSLVFHEIQSN